MIWLSKNRDKAISDARSALSKLKMFVFCVPTFKYLEGKHKVHFLFLFLSLSTPPFSTVLKMATSLIQ